MWKIHKDECNGPDSCPTLEGNVTDATIEPFPGNTSEGGDNEVQRKEEEVQPNGGFRVERQAFYVTIIMSLITL